MTFLLFQLGRDRYALDASHVIEVLPLVELRRLPEAPRGVAGIFNYHGVPVPVVDLSELTLGRPARECLGTRILLVNYPDAAGRTHPLGLIAERATGTIRRESPQLAEPGVELGTAPYLGAVLMEKEGMIQCIHAQKVLPEPVRDQLFQGAVGSLP